MKQAGKVLLFIMIIVVTLFVIISFINTESAVQKENAITEENEILENKVSITDTINIDINKIGRNTTKKLIVAKVEENSLKTMDRAGELYVVYLKNEDTSKFKQGQEVLVYFDGIIETSSPMGISADKVEIAKEKTDIEIPIEILRQYNFSQKNISVEVENLSNVGIVFNITDLNEIPLDYGNGYEYSIVKKNVENEEYNQNLEFDYDAYTPPVVTDEYSTTSSYRPDPNRLKKVWEEPELIGDEENKNCNWESASGNGTILIGKSDWTNLYGELGTGEYEFKAYRNPSEQDPFFKCVRINFTIDEIGNVTNEEPELSW